MKLPALLVSIGLLGACAPASSGPDAGDAQTAPRDASTTTGPDAGGPPVDAAVVTDAAVSGDAVTAGDAAASSDSAVGAERAGIITYYDATGAGACSFAASPGDLMVAAMDMPEFEGSAVCGECVAVTGPRGSVTVRIVDLCPECEAGHLDLSREAFALVANPVDGRVAVRWQPVECAVTGPVHIQYKDGSNQWWTALQVRNHRRPVRSLEAQLGGAWVALARQSYNYFVGTNMGLGPFTLRVTADDGQQLLETVPFPGPSTEVSGSGQFD